MASPYSTRNRVFRLGTGCQVIGILLCTCTRSWHWLRCWVTASRCRRGTGQWCSAAFPPSIIIIIIIITMMVSPTPPTADWTSHMKLIQCFPSWPGGWGVWGGLHQGRQSWSVYNREVKLTWLWPAQCPRLQTEVMLKEEMTGSGFCNKIFCTFYFYLYCRPWPLLFTLRHDAKKYLYVSKICTLDL